MSSVMLRVVKKKTSLSTIPEGTKIFCRFDIYIKTLKETTSEIVRSKWVLDIIQEQKDGDECKIELEHFRHALDYSIIHLVPSDRIFYFDNDGDVIPIEHQSELVEALKVLKGLYDEGGIENVRLLIVRDDKSPRAEESELQTDAPKIQLSTQNENLQKEGSKSAKTKLKPSTESSSPLVGLKSSGKIQKKNDAPKKPSLPPQKESLNGKRSKSAKTKLKPSTETSSLSSTPSVGLKSSGKIQKKNDAPKKPSSPQKENLNGKRSKPGKTKLRSSTESSLSSVELVSSDKSKKNASGSKKMKIETPTSKKNFPPEMYPEESHLYWFRNFLESFEKKIIAETTNAVVARLMTSLQNPIEGNWPANTLNPLANTAQTLRNLNTEITELSKDFSNIKMTNGLVGAAMQSEINIPKPPCNSYLISELEAYHKPQRSQMIKNDNLFCGKFVSEIARPFVVPDEKNSNANTSDQGRTTVIDSEKIDLKTDKIQVEQQALQKSFPGQQSFDYGFPMKYSLENFPNSSQAFSSPISSCGIGNTPMDGITLEKIGSPMGQVQTKKSEKNIGERDLNEKAVKCVKDLNACLDSLSSIITTKLVDETDEIEMVKSMTSLSTSCDDVDEISENIPSINYMEELNPDSDEISIIADEDTAQDLPNDHNFEIITVTEQNQTNQQEKPEKIETQVESCGRSSSFELVSEPPSTIDIDENEIPVNLKDKKSSEMYMSAIESISPNGKFRRHIHFSEIQTGNPGEILVDIEHVSCEQMQEVVTKCTKKLA